MVVNGKRLGAHKHIVVKDLYSVAERIKQIDKGYRIVRDVKLSRFEVWHTESKSVTPELVVPYDKLDARTISLVRSTRVESACGVIDINSGMIKM